MEPFISEIRLFAFGDPPDGWLPCDGTAMPINQYQALFSLLGTTYGGDGITTFLLPDLRGRIPAGPDGQHPAGRPFAFQGDKPSDASAQPALALNFCIAYKGTWPRRA